MPPKIPGLAKGHKRNFTSMLGGQTNLTQKVEEACIEEVVKTPQKKNLFHEAFNKRYDSSTYIIELNLPSIRDEAHEMKVLFDL